MTEEPGTAFLDLASNLLAVVMIVTLFSLLTVRDAARALDDPLPRPDPALPFATPERLLFPPFSAFYLVLEGEIRLWQEEAIIRGLLEDPGRYNSQVPGGRYHWLGDDRGAWDVDSYRLRFWPATGEATGEAATPEDLLETLWQTYRETRSAPVFVVYPSGMDAFARLYPGLEERGPPFRWFTLETGEPLLVGRYPGQFLDYGIYW